MEFIDTHTHIYDEDFRDDVDQVVERARAAGAKRLLLPCIDEACIEPMLELVARYPELCFPMMGLQPEELPDDPWPLLDRMEEHIKSGKYVAVGEVGIDLYWDTSRRDEQVEVFRHEVGWAVKYNLPLVIHCRNAHRLLCDVLSERRDELQRGGIFHCFGGTEEEARELLSFPNFYLGIGGIVTFKKSTLPDVLSSVVPLSRIVVETDAPYLTPVPYRGKRNEPAYIPHIIARLADIYATTPEQVAEITTQNAERLFF